MAEQMGWVYEFRNGLLRRMMFYGSSSEALEAVGLPSSVHVAGERGDRAAGHEYQHDLPDAGVNRGHAAATPPPLISWA